MNNCKMSYTYTYVQVPLLYNSIHYLRAVKIPSKIRAVAIFATFDTQ